MTRPSPLPNRITPFGREVASGARGGWTGNRGVIHRDYRIVRRASTNGWVCCLLDFQNRKRQLMREGRWTELFFLDEATAFAAGHRPCYFCRRKDALAFAVAWSRGQGLDGRASAPEIDAILASERRHVGLRSEGVYLRKLSNLPAIQREALAPGAIVTTTEAREAWLYTGSGFRLWRLEGYAEGAPVGPLRLLTPASALAAFRAGYAPQVHASAL